MDIENIYIKLAQKYNIPAPRYTSYPTMPYWDTNAFNIPAWKHSVKWAFAESTADGISL